MVANNHWQRNVPDGKTQDMDACKHLTLELITVRQAAHWPLNAIICACPYEGETICTV